MCFWCESSTLPSGNQSGCRVVLTNLWDKCLSMDHGQHTVLFSQSHTTAHICIFSLGTTLPDSNNYWPQKIADSPSLEAGRPSARDALCCGFSTLEGSWTQWPGRTPSRFTILRFLPCRKFCMQITFLCFGTGLSSIWTETEDVSIFLDEIHKLFNIK